MKDYDFNIIEVVDHSTNSTNGYYWEEVRVDNGSIHGQCIFKGSTGSGSNMHYRINYINKDKGIVDESNTFASWYLDELRKRRGEDNNSSSSSSSSSSSNSSSDSNCCCAGLFKFLVQVLFTIIPILLLWWIIKLIIKGGWYCFKAVGYVISWPFRLLFCCCCNTDLLPEGSMPSYWFDWE